jgi:L-2-hydroxyglutarate oxidase
MAAPAEIAIVGGGIVGLATAYAMTASRPDRRVVVLEKEPTLGAHQSSRNSGVIHAGVYYKPESLKATLCREGRRELMEFCDAQGVRYEICGKVIVAIDQSELPRLEELERRARRNQVDVRPIDRGELRELEPHAFGVRGLHVPSTGVIDFGAVVGALAGVLRARGVEICTGWEVDGLRERSGGVTVTSAKGAVEVQRVVNCAGLFADRVRQLSPRANGDEDAGPYIVPFRGEYYELVPKRRHLCRNLIYPVPDPAFPFLGVHLTRGIDGGVHVGPNAVPALAREGYQWRDISGRDLADTLRRRGTWVLFRRHWRMGAEEIWRSFRKPAFTKAVQRLCPEVQSADLVRAPSGVRAQALATDGSLLDDFAFARSGPVLHVLNCPSPAATASLAIGRYIAAMADDV